jgi:hypothetical protein
MTLRRFLALLGGLSATSRWAYAQWAGGATRTVSGAAADGYLKSLVTPRRAD